MDEQVSIHANEVDATFRDCLYKDAELGGLPAGQPPKDSVLVEGIIGKSFPKKQRVTDLTLSH